MIPWSKLPAHVQKSLLVMIILSTGATTTNCKSITPTICDPAPPPPTRVVPTGAPTLVGDTPPGPTFTPRAGTPLTTPVICDPAPPPSMTPRATLSTPVICDPAPPPPTIAAGIRFQTLRVGYDKSEGELFALIRGQVLAPNGVPYRSITVTARLGDVVVTTKTDDMGKYLLPIGQAGDYLLFVAEDEKDGTTVAIHRGDQATVDWVSVPQPIAQLPLAEIRSVEILHLDNFTFRATSPWHAARLRWSTSSGELREQEGRVVWTIPPVPGRYLLQVVADWGADGLAVDTIIAVLKPDGDIIYL